MNFEPNSKGKTPLDYLQAAAQRLRGKTQPETTTEQSSVVATEKPQIINTKAIEKAVETLKKYKEGKTSLEKRIVEDEQWWKVRHWDVIGKSDEKKTILIFFRA